MTEVLVAILRKALFIGLLYGAYFFLDRFELAAFNTAELLKNDPKAAALLLGLLSIAVALS